MSNLASSFSKLGRHEDALAMQKRVEEFRRRVLPENHPDIGEGRVGSGVACELFIVKGRDSVIEMCRYGREQSRRVIFQTREARGCA